MQLVQADLLADFPNLRLVIPHGGGPVPYHWGRFRRLAEMLGRPAIEDALMGNVFFDTCVYHQPGIDLLFEVIAVDNILFGSAPSISAAPGRRRLRAGSAPMVGVRDAASPSRVAP